MTIERGPFHIFYCSTPHIISRAGGEGEVLLPPDSEDRAGEGDLPRRYEGEEGAPYLELNSRITRTTTPPIDMI